MIEEIVIYRKWVKSKLIILVRIDKVYTFFKILVLNIVDFWLLYKCKEIFLLYEFNNNVCLCVYEFGDVVWGGGYFFFDLVFVFEL